MLTTSVMQKEKGTLDRVLILSGVTRDKVPVHPLDEVADGDITSIIVLNEGGQGVQARGRGKPLAGVD